MNGGNYTFCNCYSLSNVKCKLSFSNMSMSIMNVFQNCNNLSLDIQDIIPEDFSFMMLSFMSTFYFTQVFENCSKLTGTAPASVFWNNSYANNYVTPNGSFYNCTSLLNYDDIPQDWKGAVMLKEDKLQLV